MYQQFVNGIGNYCGLYARGLKKQANQFLERFLRDFEESGEEAVQEEIIYRFCRELCDENKYPQLRQRGNGSLPFALSRIVWQYLKKQCELDRMPQLRWTYQVYGYAFNPFDPKCEVNPYQLLERAYQHRDCDAKTVELFFRAQIDWLDWGSHHFPDACIITRSAYEETVRTAESILLEKSVDEKLIKIFRYYCMLYQGYYDEYE
ncbi:MAG: hypothetical protein K2O18_02330 [Oscillospiraceae bacterium]|nr:hypothetical protein [Oscillospiraceae bacterium]